MFIDDRRSEAPRHKLTAGGMTMSLRTCVRLIDFKDRTQSHPVCALITNTKLLGPAAA